VALGVGFAGAAIAKSPVNAVEVASAATRALPIKLRLVSFI
jgi:hypothetical protein